MVPVVEDVAWELGFWFRLGRRDWGLGYQQWDSEFRFRVWALAVGLMGAGFGDWGAGVRVKEGQGLGFKLVGDTKP